MAAAARNWRDNVWLAWFSISIAATILVDVVDFYPAALWKPAGSPLHFLALIRESYLAQYDDPIMQWTPVANKGGPAGSCMAWVPFLLALELVFLLPTAVYGAWSLGVHPSRGTTGPQELLFLVWAFHMALTTAICVHDVFWWEGPSYSAEVKRDFAFKLYGPFLVIPSLMFVDMYSRIMARFRALDTVKKTQ